MPSYVINFNQGKIALSYIFCKSTFELRFGFHKRSCFSQVKAISELVEILVNKKKVQKEDIAIITLYRGQETLLKNELSGAKSLKVLVNN